jgi:electron transfer flavoprotein alpha/beta subunit
MIDDVLLKAIRRFWSDEQVSSAYETILAAYMNRVEKVVVITGKTTESDSASAQVVVNAADYREWMATLEARMAELEAEEAGEGTTFGGTEHVTHSNRYLGT